MASATGRESSTLIDTSREWTLVRAGGQCTAYETMMRSSLVDHVHCGLPCRSQFSAGAKKEPSSKKTTSRQLFQFQRVPLSHAISSTRVSRLPFRLVSPSTMHSLPLAQCRRQDKCALPVHGRRAQRTAQSRCHPRTSRWPCSPMRSRPPQLRGTCSAITTPASIASSHELPRKPLTHSRFLKCMVTVLLVRSHTGVGARSAR